MIKLTELDKQFLNGFSETNEWDYFKNKILIPLRNELAQVDSEDGLDNFTAGEKYLGKLYALIYINRLFDLVRKYKNNVTQNNFR